MSGHFKSHALSSFPGSITRQYSPSDIPDFYLRATANAPYDAFFRAAVTPAKVAISMSYVEQTRYPYAQAVVLIDVPLPAIIPPQSDTDTDETATAFVSIDQAEDPDPRFIVAYGGDRPMRRLRNTETFVEDICTGLPLAAKICRLIRKCVPLEKKVDNESAKSDLVGWISVEVTGAMSDDCMMALILLSADLPGLRVALIDDTCIFLPHLFGADPSAQRAAVYRRLFTNGSSHIRYLDVVNVSFSDTDTSPTFWDIETWKPNELNDNIGKARDTIRGDFFDSIYDGSDVLTVGIAHHATRKKRETLSFACDGRPRVILAPPPPGTSSSPIQGGACPVDKVYADLYSTKGILRRLHAMLAYSELMTGFTRKNQSLFTSICEQSHRFHPGRIPDLPVFAADPSDKIPPVDAYRSNGVVKILATSDSHRRASIPPPIVFTTSDAICHCYLVCRIGAYTDESDFEYTTLLNAQNKHTSSKVSAPGAKTGPGPESSNNDGILVGFVNKIGTGLISLAAATAKIAGVVPTKSIGETAAYEDVSPSVEDSDEDSDEDSSPPTPVIQTLPELYVPVKNQDLENLFLADIAEYQRSAASKEIERKNKKNKEQPSKAASGAHTKSTIETTDQFFAFGHRYVCVVVTTQTEGAYSLPALAAEWLYQRTIHSNSNSHTTGVYESDAIAALVSRVPHTHTDNSHTARSHLDIRVAYSDQSDPRINGTVLNNRVAQSIRARTGKDYEATYAKDIGLFEFGKPACAIYGVRGLTLPRPPRLSKTHTKDGVRHGTPISILLLDMLGTWREKEKMIAIVSEYYRVFQAVDWYFPVVDGVGVVITQNDLELHFESLEDAGAYAKGLQDRLSFAVTVEEERFVRFSHPSSSTQYSEISLFIPPRQVHVSLLYSSVSK